MELPETLPEYKDNTLIIELFSIPSYASLFFND